MKTSLKDIMMKYGVTLGIRYTKKQKDLFYNEVSLDFKKMGYPVTTNEKTRNSYRNMAIIAGNYQDADTIIMCAYDTPSKINLPHYRYFPFNTKANLKYETYNLLFSLSLSIILFIALFFTLNNFMEAIFIEKIIRGVLSVLLGYCSYLILSDRPNKVNFNKSSAALALSLALAQELKDEKVAFILLDHNATSYEGFKAIDDLVQEHQFVIYLDALGAGEMVVIAHQEKVSSDAFKPLLEQCTSIDKAYTQEKSEANILHFFNKMFYIGSGKIVKQQFVVNNTRSKKDLNVDMKRLELMAQSLIAICKGEI